MVPDTKLAKIAVTVVPIFAPNEYGNICLNDKIPAPAIGTTKLVVIELLCTIIVINNPKNIARSAVLNMCESKNASKRSITKLLISFVKYFNDKNKKMKANISNSAL